MSQSQPPPHAAFLLRFPRELRDLIYPDIVRQASPILLPAQQIFESGYVDPPQLHPFATPRVSHPIIAAEALEAYWTCNTFIVDLDQPSSYKRWLYDPLSRAHVRHLILLVEEEKYQRVDTLEDFELRCWDDPQRQRWSALLNFRKLETLTVNMQKKHRRGLFWMHFSPVLRELRERCPGLKISFSVSFDEMLEQEWNNPIWQLAVAPPSTDKYQLTGFIDVSDVFTPVTDEDRQYVHDYLPHKEMPTTRDVMRGLLTESPAQRRVLGSLYFISEPPLLRVLMEDHWRVYKACEMKRKAHGEAKNHASSAEMTASATTK